jgi:hypothetical protein
MSPRPRRLAAWLLALAALALATAWLLLRDTPPAPDASSATTPATPAPPRPPAHQPERLALIPVAPAPDQPRSPLADTLNSPATTARDDLLALERMLALYRERFGAYPAFGDNAQLVNALAGANPARLGLLPRDIPAIDTATGQLLDRWGEPYHFHALSRHALELRSAGPDRQLYTDDDVTLPLGGLRK